MSTPNYDPSKLASIKTYMLIAFIFNIIGMIGFALAGIGQIISYATFAPYYSGFAYYGAASTFLIVEGIVFLVFFVLALLVFLRVRKMYTAANRGDIQTLKQYNNMMWAIIALIFTGVIAGIMLLISFGPINELGQAPMSSGQGAYPPPPPPPS
jgi:putative membrane protein